MGVTTPDAIPQAAGRLAAFLDAGRHGQMGWMEERAGWRGDPAALWPEARSVLMLAEPGSAAIPFRLPALWPSWRPVPVRQEQM